MRTQPARNSAAPNSVDELMTDDIIAIGSTDPVSRARDLMIGLGIHALPVLDDGKAVGIVTSADLVDEWPENFPVSEVMTAQPFTIGRHATVGEAAEEMLGRQVHHLIVTEGKAVVGILSSFDLLFALLPR